jgi:hypothetical protein
MRTRRVGFAGNTTATDPVIVEPAARNEKEVDE